MPVSEPSRSARRNNVDTDQDPISVTAPRPSGRCRIRGPRWRLLIVVEPSDLDRFHGELDRGTADPGSKSWSLTMAPRGSAQHRDAGGRDRVRRDPARRRPGTRTRSPSWRTALRRASPTSTSSTRRAGSSTTRRSRSAYVQPAEERNPGRLPRVPPVKHLLCWRQRDGLAIGGLDERSASVGPDDFDFPWTMAEHGARFQAVAHACTSTATTATCVRLTTHLPISVHVKELRRVFRKHGVNRRQIRDRTRAAERSHLPAVPVPAKLDERLAAGSAVPRVWHDTYR